MMLNRTWLLCVTCAALALGPVAWRSLPRLADAQPGGGVAAGDGLTPAAPPGPADRRGGSARAVIGWDRAHERLGHAMPTGREIPVGQVEAGESYAPNAADPRLRGVSFILQSGGSGDSGHASNVARHAFGGQGPAPGVARVHCYAVQHWMGEGYLRTGSDQPPDDWNQARVFNHSWISERSGNAVQVLRRVDWLADQRDILCVVGLNNGRGDVPALLASAYNTISVGVVNGNHSSGLTHIEGEGRCKPELVAPGTLTSWSTPQVTGCVAVLLEQADAMGRDDDASPDRRAARSEVVKALLMGGAHKPADWGPGEGEPLDRRWGAGIVDLDRALLMLDGGNTAPGQTTQRYAWAAHALAADQQHAFTFTTLADQGEACFTLVWNRKVAGGTVTLRHNVTGASRTAWNNSAGLADLDLELVRVDADGVGQVVAASTSTVDNVEVIYLRELPAGTWSVRVKRRPDAYKIAWDYALAWRIEAAVASE